MNAEDRKRIEGWTGHLTALKREIENIACDVESMQDDEQGKFDNLPEGLQNGEQGEKLQNAIDNLSQAKEELSDAVTYAESAISSLESAAGE